MQCSMYSRTVLHKPEQTRFLKYIAAARYACNEHITKHGRERPQFVTRSNREHLPSAASSAELELTAHRLRVCPIRSGLLPLSSIRKTQPCFSYKKRRRDFGGVQNVPPVTKSAGAMRKIRPAICVKKGGTAAAYLRSPLILWESHG